MIFPWSEAESCSQRFPFGTYQRHVRFVQRIAQGRLDKARYLYRTASELAKWWENMGNRSVLFCFFRFNYLISTQRRANEISWDWCESCLKRRACRVACPEAIPCLKSKARRQIARERRRALKLSGDFRGIFDPYSEWIELKIIWVCKKEMIRI